MGPSGIVKLEVPPESSSGFRDRFVGSQVHLLVLDALPQSFDEHVILPAPLPVHADLDHLKRLEDIRAALSGELPVSVNERIKALMRENVDGPALIAELEKMLEELPPADETDEPQSQSDDTIRVVCSMGITPAL